MIADRAITEKEIIHSATFGKLVVTRGLGIGSGRYFRLVVKMLEEGGSRGWPLVSLTTASHGWIDHQTGYIMENNISDRIVDSTLTLRKTWAVSTLE